VTIVQEFIREFFDQNPISQLGLIVAYQKIADKLTELSGNPLQQIRLLTAKQNEIGGGEISLQNALEIAKGSLR
jgi:transcription initiation factor TFIIH subunit 2